MHSYPLTAFTDCKRAKVEGSIQRLSINSCDLEWQVCVGAVAVHFGNFSELRTSAIRRLLPLPGQLGQFSVDARIIFSCVVIKIYTLARKLAVD